MSLLVVSAVQFEAEASLEVLKHAEYFEIGIGCLAAAKSEAALAERCRGRDVLYLGSCGSFYPFEKVHLITADKTFWMPPCLRTGIAGAPEHLYPPIEFPESKFDLPRKSVLTSPSVSLVSHIEPHVQSTLPPKDHLVENMELYACANALLQSRSLNVILGVTNEVGPEGRKQWAASFRKVATLTAEFVDRQHLLT